MANARLIKWQTKEVAGASKSTIRLVDGSAPTHLERFILNPLATWLQNHPCIGARQLGAEKTFYACVLGEMGRISTSLDFLNCLDSYFEETAENDPVLKSLLVCFQEPISSKEDFFQKFWGFSQTTHDIDFLTHGWDETVEKSPASDSFELSFRGRAVFPTTFHPFHDRPARHFSYPGWAHNLSSQFANLRESGQFEVWQKKIRKADAAVDPSCSPNPLLADTGQASAAAQLGQVIAEHYPFAARCSEDRDQIVAALTARAHQEDAAAVIAFLRTL